MGADEAEGAAGHGRGQASGRGRGRGVPDKKAGRGVPSANLPPKWERAAKKAGEEDWKRQELERRNHEKYKYLKFVEKQKVERRLKQAKKALLEAKASGTPETVEEKRQELTKHLTDVEYIDHYPRHLPYNALFPKEESEFSQQRREEIRKLVKQRLIEQGIKPADGALADPVDRACDAPAQSEKKKRKQSETMNESFSKWLQKGNEGAQADASINAPEGTEEAAMAATEDAPEGTQESQVREKASEKRKRLKKEKLAQTTQSDVATTPPPAEQGVKKKLKKKKKKAI